MRNVARLPAILLAAAGIVLIVLAVAFYAHRGRANAQPSVGAAAVPHATASTVPSSSPRPSPVRLAAHGNPFGATVRPYLASRSGTVLAAVYDMRTGQLWTVGQGQAQDEASIVKLDILETLLSQHRAVGTVLSAKDESLAEAMIEDSDNDAATSLWYAVGGAGAIRSFNASVGLTHTTPSSCVDCPGFPWPGWGLTTTTPADQLFLLRELVRPNAQLTDAQRRYALGLMENVTGSQRWGVTGGVPSRVTVALKNGWLPLTSMDDDWQINSIGSVSGGGRDYLMAVLVTGNPTEQYGIDTIDELSAMVWDRMR